MAAVEVERFASGLIEAAVGDDVHASDVFTSAQDQAFGVGHLDYRAVVPSKSISAEYWREADSRRVQPCETHQCNNEIGADSLSSLITVANSRLAVHFPRRTSHDLRPQAVAGQNEFLIRQLEFLFQEIEPLLQVSSNFVHEDRSLQKVVAIGPGAPVDAADVHVLGVGPSDRQLRHPTFDVVSESMENERHGQRPVQDVRY